MIRRGSQPRAPRRIELGRGVALTVKPVSAVTLSRVSATAARDLDALTDGRDTKRDWRAHLDEDALAALDDPANRDAVYVWIRSVLLAEASATALDGVLDEDGRPAAPTFDTLAWLFRDGVFEVAFRAQALAAEQVWRDEGNVSSAAPAGPTAAALNSAPAVAPPAKPAPPADAPPTAVAVPSSPTAHAPPLDNSPGSSPATPAVGPSQASPASPSA